MSKRQAKGHKKGAIGLAFGKTNYQLLGAAAVVLLVGYWALSQPPVDGFLSLTFGPILLFVGYCILIPLGLIYSKGNGSDSKETSGTVV
ncbi:MAG: hypothetical protein R3245_13175 [Kiloniellales bacterium]|nr:hypothetical protein [Kiloniellales bacterium]